MSEFAPIRLVRVTAVEDGFTVTLTCTDGMRLGPTGPHPAGTSLTFDLRGDRSQPWVIEMPEDWPRT